MPTTSYTVGSTAELNAAIQAIDLTGTAPAPDTACTISFGNSVALPGQLYAINLTSSDTLDGGAHNGLFDYAGQVSTDDLTIQNAKVTGGSAAEAQPNLILT